MQSKEEQIEKLQGELNKCNTTIEKANRIITTTEIEAYKTIGKMELLQEQVEEEKKTPEVE